MKLKPLSTDKGMWLKEFDHWVTPYLEEIKDSKIFHRTLADIKEVINLLSAQNDEFKSDSSSSAKHILDAVLNGINGQTADKIYSLIIAFCDFLFLITGKTDNNFKCQFPVYLKESLKWQTYPSIKAGKLASVEIPRVITSESVSKLVVKFEYVKQKQGSGLSELALYAEIQKAQNLLLLSYFEGILDQNIYLRSITAFGTKYCELRQKGAEDDILAPLIVFYVRGSASAVGGHLPEKILRQHMNNWGLRANEDFNTIDAIAYINSSKTGAKTRAYDFVLPFQVKGWNQLIFIQSQFYAGDSGSVSHKNVDQTSISRQSVKRDNPNAKFVEYVDGAGYYGSLNGDLQRLFYMGDTDNFFQVRTSHIKLRQLLQSIQFLTPLELIHALVISSFDIKNAGKQLMADGYSDSEIDRVIDKTIREKIGSVENGIMKIDESFYEMSRKYFLLDSLAIYGQILEKMDSSYALVPGYDEYFGAKISEVISQIKDQSGSYFIDWQNPEKLSSDVEFLIRHKWIILNS